MNPNSTQLIQAMLAPGILIVATSILLFSTNSRYSMVVERIRLLKQERLLLRDKKTDAKKDSKLLDRIELQISHLIHRISLVRLIIASYSAALVFFAASSVLLSIRNTFEINGYFWVSIGILFAGLLALINGVIFSLIEVFKAYRIVHIEIAELTQDLEKY